jgi:hypothetical protein
VKNSYPSLQQAGFQEHSCTELLKGSPPDSWSDISLRVAIFPEVGNHGLHSVPSSSSASFSLLLLEPLAQPTALLDGAPTGTQAQLLSMLSIIQ